MTGGTMTGGMMTGGSEGGAEMGGGESAGDEVIGGADEVGDPCLERAPDVTLPCEVTIYEAKNTDRVVDNRLVTIEGVLTAKRSGDEGPSHWILQVSPSSPEYARVGYSAIWIYLNDTEISDGSLIDPEVGETLRVTARTANFFGQRQLQVITSATSLGRLTEEITPFEIEPAAVLADPILSLALEGVLVETSPVSVIEVNPEPGPGDRAPNREFIIEGNMRVNDFIYRYSPLPAVGDTWPILRGIMRFGNGALKIEPRDAEDLGRPSLPGDVTGLVISEIDYSNPGADRAEFIEIMNVGIEPAPLWGVRVQLINGNGLTVYEVIDLGEAGESLQPGELLVIGSEEVLSTLADGPFRLSLPGSIQNGPDGVKIIDERLGVIDSVAYGNESMEEGLSLEEGQTSVVDLDDETRATSIGRCDEDTDVNANDFVLMTATPGAMNSCL